MSILETGMHSTGSESPVPVCIYVIYGVFLGTLVIFHTCAPADAPHQLVLTVAYVVMT